MQLETGKQDLPGILVEDQAAPLRNAVVAPMNAETVHVFAASIQDQLENLVELGDAGFAGDQETPPDQWTRASEHDSQLIKLCHGSRLPKPAPNFPTTPPESAALLRMFVYVCISFVNLTATAQISLQNSNTGNLQALHQLVLRG